MCANLLFQRMKDPDFSIAILLCAALLSVAMLFLFCYFGKVSTEKFIEMPDCLYESTWNEFSIEVQKFYLIILGAAQRPHFYHGFGVIYLNLETFTMVSKFQV